MKLLFNVDGIMHLEWKWQLIFQIMKVSRDDVFIETSSPLNLLFGSAGKLEMSRSSQIIFFAFHAEDNVNNRGSDFSGCA